MCVLPLPRRAHMTTGDCFISLGLQVYIVELE